MTRAKRAAASPRPAAEGTLAIVLCPEAFALEPGHRMRAAHCVICRKLIGGQPATVIGVVGLGGEACTCGAVVSDTFLIHAIHLPISPMQLAAAIHRGLACTQNHD